MIRRLPTIALCACVASIGLASTVGAAPVANGLQGGSYNAGAGGRCCGYDQAPSRMDTGDFWDALARGAYGHQSGGNASGKHGVGANAGKGHAQDMGTGNNGTASSKDR